MAYLEGACRERRDAADLHRAAERLVEVELGRGRPAVRLTDLKTRYTEQYLFSTSMPSCTMSSRTISRVVVGGYSFGDRPLNRALARYLSRSADNDLLAWNPSGA